MVKELEVITGCMFSGKSTELLRRLHDVDNKFILLKPKLDIRYSFLDEVITHSGKKNLHLLLITFLKYLINLMILKL